LMKSNINDALVDIGTNVLPPVTDGLIVINDYITAWKNFDWSLTDILAVTGWKEMLSAYFDFFKENPILQLFGIGEEEGKESTKTLFDIKKEDMGLGLFDLSGYKKQVDDLTGAFTGDGKSDKSGLIPTLTLTKEELAAVQKAAKLANEKENYKEVKGMEEIGLLTGIKQEAALGTAQVHGLTEALANKDTGLIGKFPELKENAYQASLKLGLVESTAYSLSEGLKIYNPNLATLVDNVWKIASDSKLEKSEIPGLFRSIGTAAGGANTQVGGLFTLLGTFVESGFNPISLAIGGLSLLFGENKTKADSAITSWEGVERVLGTTGTAMRTLNDELKAVNDELELDVLTAMETKMENLSYQIATKTAEYEKLYTAGQGGDYGAKKSAENLKKIIDQMQLGYDALAAQAESYTEAFALEEKYDAASDSITTLTEKYNALSDKFGDSANLEGLKELLGKATEESQALLDTLTPNTTAFDELNKKIDAARTLLQGLVTDMDAVGDADFDLPGVTTGETGKVPAYAEGGYVPDAGLAMLHDSEFVLSRQATAAIGTAQLKEFNATLDPASLSGGSRAAGATVVNIIAGNTTPETWFRVSDKHIQPRIDQRTRKFQVKENPYAK